MDGDIPILVGGDSTRPPRRAVRMGDGYFPGATDPEGLGRRSPRSSRLQEAGRDPNSLEINAIFSRQLGDPAAGIESMREQGVGRIMVPAFAFAGDGGLDRLRAFGEAHVAPNAA